MRAIDGHKITSYGRRPLAIRTGDSNDLKRENVHDFHAVNIEIPTSIDVHRRGLVVKSSTLDIKNIDAQKCDKLLAKGCAAYVMTPRMLQNGESMTLFCAI